MNEYIRIGKYLMTPRKWYNIYRKGFKKHETLGSGKWKKVWLRVLGEDRK